MVLYPARLDSLPGGPPVSREEFLDVGARSLGGEAVVGRGEGRRLGRGRLRAGDSSLRRLLADSGLLLRRAAPREVELGCSLKGAKRGKGRILPSAG